MYRNMLFGCLLILPLIGCGTPSSSAVSDGTILTYLGDPSVQTSIEYVGLDNRIVLVIWSDVVGSSSSNSTSSVNGVILTGKFNSNDGRELAWKCEASADGGGILMLGGNEYDLADGYVFLVSAMESSFNVQQVRRKTTATSDIDRTVRELAKEKEITEFFSQQARDNGT